MPIAIGAPELSLVLLLLIVVVVPIAGIAFSRSGKGLAELGKGTFAIDREEPSAPGEQAVETPAEEHEEEVRQLVEASNFRRRARGDDELDVEAEIDRLLGVTGAGDEPEDSTEAVEADAGAGAGGAGANQVAPDGLPAEGGPGIREEIRQLVIANNERRARRGEDPLDVESEVDRRMAEWT